MVQTLSSGSRGAPECPRGGSSTWLSLTPFDPRCGAQYPPQGPRGAPECPRGFLHQAFSDPPTTFSRSTKGFYNKKREAFAYTHIVDLEAFLCLFKSFPFFMYKPVFVNFENFPFPGRSHFLKWTRFRNQVILRYLYSGISCCPVSNK